MENNSEIKTIDAMYRIISNSVDSTKKFIKEGLYDVALDELEHLQRLIDIQKNHSIKVTKNQYDFINRLTRG